MIRPANEKDIDAVTHIYDAIIAEEEAHRVTIGWKRGIYPVRSTAETALKNHTLFVLEDEGKIVASARFDQIQVPEYAKCKWQYEVPENKVMVLHTLVVDPAHPHRGYGRAFVKFYEEYALEHGCHFLRIDTNEINKNARAMYDKLGFHEVGIVPCVFNGIEGVHMVCLEKHI